MLKIDLDDLANGSADIDVTLFKDGTYSVEQSICNGVNVIISVPFIREDIFNEGDCPRHVLIKVTTDLESIEEHPSSKE